MDTEWATVDSISPEKDEHISGTIPRFKGVEFWMFNPPKPTYSGIRCGICKRKMGGNKHCPYCYKENNENNILV